MTWPARGFARIEGNRIVAQDWEIKARASACGRCGAPFTDKQGYHSALTIEEGRYQRGDYCSACWPEVEAAASPYSEWRAVFHAPPPEPEAPLKKENAETLLRRLIAEEAETRRNVIFILTVMLERTKVFAERDVQLRDDGLLSRIYEHRKTGETFVILDPCLRLEQLAQVEQEVMDMLGIDPTGRKKAPPEAETASDAAAPAAGEPGEEKQA